MFNDANIINEESPRLLDSSDDKDYLATSEYSLAKAREENIISASQTKNWTIVRPYITYNSERLQLGFFEKEDWLIRAINGQTIVFPNDLLAKRTTITYGGDVAHCIFKMIGNPRAIGQYVNVTSDESLTWKEVIDYYSAGFEHVYGKKMNYKFVGNKDIYSRIFKSKKYQINYCRMFNRVFDNSKCNRFIAGDFNFISAENGLENCLRQFRERGSCFLSINPFAQAFFDRKSHEISSLCTFKGTRAKWVYIISRFVPMPFSFYAKLFNNFIDRIS